MKKIALLLAGVALMVSCNKSPQNNEIQESIDKQDTISEQHTVDKENNAVPTFNINDVAISTADIGDFPFFTAPEGAEYINRVKPMDFDFMVFVTPNDIYEVEGKTFRAFVHPDRKSGKEISARYLIRSYEDAIAAAGGVKVFEGILPKGERRDKYAELCTYAGSNGSIDIWNNPIATYVIRRDDGNIYIALDKGDGRTTSIQIVQEKAFTQTIEKVTSDDIAKDLAEKGKSILYINFDVDKSNVTADGKEVIDQIAGALKKEPLLKIAIEGHTDNTGDVAHNKKLSNDRANTVLNALVSNGIEKTRLSAKGFGAERPLVANDSEDNKAKNRRVELVKVN